MSANGHLVHVGRVVDLGADQPRFRVEIVLAVPIPPVTLTFERDEPPARVAEKLEAAAAEIRLVLRLVESLAEQEEKRCLHRSRLPSR